MLATGAYCNIRHWPCSHGMACDSWQPLSVMPDMLFSLLSPSVFHFPPSSVLIKDIECVSVCGVWRNIYLQFTWFTTSSSLALDSMPGPMAQTIFPRNEISEKEKKRETNVAVYHIDKVYISWTWVSCCRQHPVNSIWCSMLSHLFTIIRRFRNHLIWISAAVVDDASDWMEEQGQAEAMGRNKIWNINASKPSIEIHSFRWINIWFSLFLFSLFHFLLNNIPLAHQFGMCRRHTNETIQIFMWFLPGET